MNDVLVAWTEAEATAVAAVEQHHEQLAAALAGRVESLTAAAARREEAPARFARDDLVAWCQVELVPHAVAEEKAMYPAAQAKDAGRLLVEGMLAEHGVIIGLVEEIDRHDDLVRAAGAATALRVMFESHLTKENELVLPLLAGAADVSVAELLGGMHELLGGAEHAAGTQEDAGCGCHGCGCADGDGS
jgi:iron-sulfur cluster repair protein YtfE (RIC family)